MNENIIKLEENKEEEVKEVEEKAKEIEEKVEENIVLDRLNTINLSLLSLESEITNLSKKIDDKNEIGFEEIENAQESYEELPKEETIIESKEVEIKKRIVGLI